MELPWRFSATMIQMQAYDLERIATICHEAGIERLEGSYRMLDALSDRELDALARRYEQAGVRFDSFHLPLAPGEIDLASFYETQRRASVQRTAAWIERSARVGTRIGVQHAGNSLYNVEREGVDRFMDQLRKSLDELLPVAERHDYTLALENIGARDHSPRFGSLPEHFQRVRREIDHPNLGFCFDTGHGLMSLGLDQEDRMFDAMGERLCAFHLADNTGDNRDAHLAPGRGLVNWRSVFRRAAAAHFIGTMCIEAPPFAPGPNYSTDAWRQLFEDTAALAREALAN